jgi:hypothetical protein
MKTQTSRNSLQQIQFMKWNLKINSQIQVQEIPIQLKLSAFVIFSKKLYILHAKLENLGCKTDKNIFLYIGIRKETFD